MELKQVVEKPEKIQIQISASFDCSLSNYAETKTKKEHKRDQVSRTGLGLCFITSQIGQEIREYKAERGKAMSKMSSLSLGSDYVYQTPRLEPGCVRYSH